MATDMRLMNGYYFPFINLGFAAKSPYYPKGMPLIFPTGISFHLHGERLFTSPLKQAKGWKSTNTKKLLTLLQTQFNKKTMQNGAFQGLTTVLHCFFIYLLYQL